MDPSYPLISCICITNNRIFLLKKAIQYFKSQDYPNKELVISYPKNDKLTKYTIDKIRHTENLNILKVEREIETNLGDARNQAIMQANGLYVCTWDDDDWYHASRLSFQFTGLQGLYNPYQASILNQLLLYDQTNKKAYLSFLYTWENTLLCKKEIFLKNQYSSKHQGEDSNIIDYLNAEKLLHHVSKAPFLYIYVYHQGNTWNYAHFQSFFKRSEPLDDVLSAKIHDLIDY